MPGDTLYVKNLQIESNISASGNGFSSTGYGNLSYDGTVILGTGGVGNWTKDGTSIYYDGENVGIQNTNPQHALSLGSSAQINFEDKINISSTDATKPIAIGNHAGRTNQGVSSIAIGEFAGYQNQKSNAIAIGNHAGRNSQSSNSIAIGDRAGYFNMGDNAICIGPVTDVAYNYSLCISTNGDVGVGSENSIIINAKTDHIESSNPGFYVSPIRTVTDFADGILTYRSDSEVVKTSNLTISGLVGIQNTNPQYALTIGSPANVYVDTSTRSLVFGNLPITDDGTIYSNPNTVIKKDLIQFNDESRNFKFSNIEFTVHYSTGIVHTTNSLTLTTSNTFYFKTNGFLPDAGSTPSSVYTLRISPNQLTVPTGQLLIGHSSPISSTKTGRIDIRTNDSDFEDAHVSNGSTYKTLYPAMMISTNTYGNGLRWSIGINVDNTAILFDSEPAAITSNCMYFIPGGSGSNNQTKSSSGNYFEQGGYIKIFDSDGTFYGGNQMNFTGQHRCKSENMDLYSNTYIGYIVGSNGTYSMIGSSVKTTSNNIHINECLPYVSLTDTEKQSNVFGVISNIEDKNSGSRQMIYGVWGSVIPKPKGDTRVIVNSLGEGAIWVSNVNGPLKNGDYITTSSIPGLGMKQNENQLMNYTVAKITMDCDFNPVEEPIMVARTQTVEVKNEKYETNTYTVTETRTVFDPDTGHWIQKKETITKSEREQVFEEVDLYNEQGEIIGKHTVPVYETGTKQENVLDENGQLVFDDSGQTQPAYLIKYVSSDGTILDSEQPGCYKMAFVGCTYHCG